MTSDGDYGEAARQALHGLRAVLGHDPASIEGSAVEAALLPLIQLADAFDREVERLGIMLLESLDEVEYLRGLVDDPRGADRPIWTAPARCPSVGPPTAFRDGKIDRTARPACQLPPGHHGDHTGTLAGIRDVHWTDTTKEG